MKFSQIPRTTLSYLAVIVLLGGVYVVQETSAPQRNTIPIPEIADEVDRIVMERDSTDGTEDSRVELYRVEDGWRVRGNGGGGSDPAATEARSDNASEVATTGDPDGADDSSGSFLADGATVDAILQDLERLSTADVISTRANYEDYGLVDGETRRLRFFVGGTQPLALEFGAGAAAGDAVYGRINGSREIVLLPRALDTAIVTDPDELRDTAVVRLPEEQITQVEVSSPSHATLTLSRERPGDSTTAAAEEGEPVWRIEPESEEEPIAPGRVRDFFTELNPLRAQEFLSEDPQGEPFAEILVRRGGDRSPEEIRIWPPDQDRRYPVYATSAEQAVLIPEWRARRLLLGVERYFEPFVEDDQASGPDQASVPDQAPGPDQPAAD